MSTSENSDTTIGPAESASASSSARAGRENVAGRIRRALGVPASRGDGRSPWLPVLNPDALKSAARAAIVMPAVFAFSDQVIARPQTSIFAAFGSFAVLVLTEFGGAPRTRLGAYFGLACTGAVFVTVGTLCSRHPWLAAVAMALVGFATLFAGAFSGYVTAGATGALLTFVLPVTISAPNAAIPDRLLGWGIASGVGTCAVMLLWPPRARADLRRDAALAVRAAAELMDADGGTTARAPAAQKAVAALRRRSLGSQHRVTGHVAAAAALASLPDELDWLVSSFAPSLDEPPFEGPEDVEAVAAASAVLYAAAERLDGRDVQPDLARLDAAREAGARTLLSRLPTLEHEADVSSALAGPFRIRVATYAARQVGAYALVATEAAAPPGPHDPPAAHASPRTALVATERFALEHARARSVWLQNSVRGAVGLAIAVYIAQRTGLQHGFWVVLGMLSVLRSNALATGWSIVSALAGTAVGIVVGALLVIAIGTHPDVLWGVLPVAVLLAAYAPRAISFAAGQAGFTVVLFILFNIIQPVGWRVGVVRVEDVAIGFAISLAVGLLFWPRGAASLLGRDLAEAYATGVDYVVAAARLLTGRGDPEADERAARAAEAASHRLDDSFRQYLSERSATRVDVETAGAFVAGAARLRRAAQSLEAFAQMADGGTPLERCAEHLDGELYALQSWYVALGYAIVNRRPLPPPHIRDTVGRRSLIGCLRQAADDSPDGQTRRASLMLLWADQHLDSLWQLEAHLGARASS